LQPGAGYGASTSTAAALPPGAQGVRRQLVASMITSLPAAGSGSQVDAGMASALPRRIKGSRHTDRHSVV